MNEKNYLVMELKGLLDGLERHVEDVKFNLSIDNVQQLTDETDKMRKLLGRIDGRIEAYNRIFERDDELI